MDNNNEKSEVQTTVEINLKPEVLICYGHAWKQIWKYFAELFIILIISFSIGFLVELVRLPISIISSFVDESNLILIPFVVLNFLFYIAFVILLSQPIQLGIAYANLRASRGENLEIKDMFAFFRNYWNVVLAAFLTNLIIGIGMIFLLVPGIIFACKLAFVPYLVMDRKMQATDAIQKSWSMTDGYALKIFLMALLVFPIVIGGFLCLFFGVIISYIWINLAVASMYYAVCLEKGISHTEPPRTRR